MNVLKNAHFPVSGEETINFIDSGEKAVRWPWVEVETDAEVTVKLSEDTPAENAWIVKSHAVIPCNASTIYISGSANVQIVGLTTPGEASFKTGGKGGESWVNAEGNPVTLTGLQGGVPFNSVTVIGKNLIPFPYRTSTKTLSGVTFTVNADGSISCDGTATATIYFQIMFDNITDGVKTLSGCPSGGTTSTYMLAIADRTLGTNRNYKYDTGNGVVIDDYPPNAMVNMFIQINSGVDVTGLVFRPQLENGGEKTSYEPPITGREMTLTVSGKNHIPNTYKSTTINDMTFTVNADGSIHAVGTAPTGGANYRVTANMPLSAYGLKPGDTVFCSAENAMTTEGEMHFKFRVADGTFIKDYNSKREFVPYTIPDNVVSMDITLWFPAGGTYDSVYYPQIEIGNKYTGYEPPKGIASYTITPDTNPYTVPIDITQVDGTNVITADNDAVITVNANRKNPQIAKIYEKINELTTAVITLGGMD